jgi:TRAP-type C4-dicarboxylate transport system permease small subunit
MTTINRVLDWILDMLVVLALVAIALVLGLQIVYRYLLNNPLAFPMPFSLFLFVWMVWLGGAVGIRDEGQIRMEFAERYLPESIKRFLIPSISLVCTGFILVVIYMSIEVVKIQASTTYDTLPFSRAYLFVVAPIVGSVMFLQYLRVFLRQVRRYFFPKETKPDA